MIRPLFSIITVVRNAPQALKVTLESVASQTCALYEHLIIDGASTDSTLSEIEKIHNPRIKLTSEPDRGIYDAMNKGLRLAQGDYVMFLNAGDTLATDHTLQLLADTAMDHDYPGIIYGETMIVNHNGKILGARHLRAPETLTFESFAQGMLVCHQAFVVLKKLTVEFDERYRLSADYDWCLKCLKRSRRNHFVETVTIHYLFDGASTRHRFKSLRERFAIMCRHYGTIPTIMRHIKFLPRFLKRHQAEKKFDK